LCEELTAGKCCLGTLHEYIDDVGLSSAALSQAIDYCDAVLEECIVIDGSSSKCDLVLPQGPDPTDNSCIAAWVEANSITGALEYEFQDNQPFITAVTSEDGVPSKEVFALSDWPEIENCTRSGNNCPSFLECFDIAKTAAVSCTSDCTSSFPPDAPPLAPEAVAPPDEEDDNGLSTSVMVGIVFLTIIGAIAALGCCFCFFRSRSRNKGSHEENTALRNQTETLSQKAFTTPRSSANVARSARGSPSVTGNAVNGSKYSARMAAARNASRTTSARSGGRYSSRTIQLKEMNASMRSITGDDAL